MRRGRARRPDVLRPAGVQRRRFRQRTGDREAHHRGVRAFRLRRRAVRVLRRDAARALSPALPHRRRLARAGAGARRAYARARELPRRHPRRARGRRALRGGRDLPRLLLGAARDGGPRPAAPPARIGGRADGGGDAGLGRLLRLRRDVLREVPGDLHPPRRREMRQRPRHRRGSTARRRSGLPDEHRAKARARIASGALILTVEPGSWRCFPGSAGFPPATGSRPALYPLSASTRARCPRSQERTTCLAGPGRGLSRQDKRCRGRTSRKRSRTGPNGSSVRSLD